MLKIPRVTIIGGGFLLLAIAVVFFASKKAEAPQPTLSQIQTQKIKVGVIDVDPSVAYSAAENQGFFPKYNLEVETVNVRGGSVESLIAGQIDFLIMRIASPLSASLEGADIRWIGLLEKNFPYILYSRVAKEEINVIGVNRLGGVDHYHTLIALDAAGINPAKINFIPTEDGRGKVIMLSKRQIDAAGINLFYAFEAEKELTNYQEIINLTDQSESAIPLGVLTTEKFLNSSPDAAKNFLQSLIKATFWAQKHPQETTEIISQANKISLDQAKIVYEQFLSNTQNANFTLTPEIVQPILKAISDVKEKAVDFKFDSFVNNWIVEEIKNAGFLEKVQKEN